MRYERYSELDALKADGLISARPHPNLPLTIYNYSVKAQFLPVAQWTDALKDCRGLILDRDGEIVARPFRKFWNLEQVSEFVPQGPFDVWEKLDGSLGIVASYAGELVVSTRGSFESDQSRWFLHWLNKSHADFYPSGETWLFEIIYPENRIVVDYKGRQDAVLLAVMSPDGVDLWPLFDESTRFPKARRFDGMKDFETINQDPRFSGEEGFVLQWASGYRAKVKLDEYKRLHRLITQCSTRTIWELLRSGTGIAELLNRVPEEFAGWVNNQSRAMRLDFAEVKGRALYDFEILRAHEFLNRKDFAMAAKERKHSQLLFSLLDGKDISEAAWKQVEPKWSTPFRKELDA